MGGAAASRQPASHGLTSDTINTTYVPLIFIPGIMGSRLQIPHNGLNWDPDDSPAMAKWIVASVDDCRQALSVQETPDATVFRELSRFRLPGSSNARADILAESELVELARRGGASDPVAWYEGRGWGGVAWGFYGPILMFLETRFNHPRHHPSGRHPVYALGYDWRKGNEESSRALTRFMDAVLREQRGASQVILVTHSMGGLVARHACSPGGAADRVLGVVHNAHPFHGALAAYRRFFTGCTRSYNDGSWPLTLILGNRWWKYAAYMSGLPGAMQLLPTHRYHLQTPAMRPLPESVPQWFLNAPQVDLATIYDVYRRDSPPGIVRLKKELPWNADRDIVRIWEPRIRPRLQSGLAKAQSFHKSLQHEDRPRTYVVYVNGIVTDEQVNWTAKEDRRFQQTGTGDATVPSLSGAGRGLAAVQHRTMIHGNGALPHADVFKSAQFREQVRDYVRGLLNHGVLPPAIGPLGTAGSPPATQPPPEPALRIISVDPHFAPGVEPLTLVYTAQSMENEQVYLRVTSAIHPNNPIFERELTAAEKAGGARKTIDWDGKANCASGPLANRLITPGFSPYRISLEASPTIRDESEFAVLAHEIQLLTSDAAGIWMMNDPTRKISVEAKVLIKKKDKTGAPPVCDVEVVFTFRDPTGANTVAAQSHQYPPANRPLGKAADAAAVFWEADPAFPAGSDDGFRGNAKVMAPTSGQDQGRARVRFMPSGVGGDVYRVKATVAGNGPGLEKESDAITVVRRVEFRPYEMMGQSHVSTHGTDAIMAGYYTPATFVQYHLGAVTQLPASVSVNYIGLWDHATSSQRNWAKWSAKLAGETPTAAETAAANSPGPGQAAARAAIQAKADAWRDRIATAFMDGLDHWATDAKIPADAMVAIEFHHPKYAAHAPDADSLTNEWSAFAWLSVTINGNPVHPDKRWNTSEGFSYDGRAYVMAGTSGNRVEIVVAHEAGHESKNQFNRAVFGPNSDHSTSRGLMDPTGSRGSFTAREIKILRGILP